MFYPFRILLRGAYEFSAWLIRLFRLPLFWYVSLWLHLVIFLAAAFFYYFEKEANVFPYGFYSAYYWAISTATTTGNSDILPKTVEGMGVSIALMIAGALFLWSYTALFAATLVNPAVRKVRRDVHLLEDDVKEVEREVIGDRASLEELKKEIASLKQYVKEKL